MTARVSVRFASDMILRTRLKPDQSLELNRLFTEYQKFFGEAQKLGKTILNDLGTF